MNPFIISIAIISLLDAAGVLTAKLYSLNKNPWLLIIIAGLFGGAGLVFARSLRYEGMVITNVLWIALSVIIVTMAGYFIFKEDIALIQIAGIIIITVGLILINLK